jgi:H+/Cl- antiporter ClcA/predicted transcriptional regulator
MTTILAAIVGVLAAGAAWALQWLILLFTNGLFFGRLSAEKCDSWDSPLPFLWVVIVPIAGSIVMGCLARFISERIRGDGIPQVMESILVRESLISPLVAFLKPLSAAIVIGTGNPFGAEGPIIATGGALGSVLGQLFPVSAVERKALLAAGAAAGISAMFGSPVAGVILAIELLLFERRQRTLIPVAVASAIAFMVSRLYSDSGPLFPMPACPQAAHAGPLAICFLLGLPAGLAAILVTRSVIFFEDRFEKLPIHWMWWPAIGSVALAGCAWFEPRVLGFGYSNIAWALDPEHFSPGHAFTLGAAASLFVWKLLAWSICLGTGTSGGILAPVLTIGAALGAAFGFGLDRFAPGISPGVPLAALAVMSGVFGATARAPVATIVFALELTHRPEGLPAVLAACAAAQLVTIWLLPHSLMTEKIARSGLPIGHEYVHDELSLLRARDVMSTEVLTIPASLSLAELVEWLAPGGLRTKHQGYPVVDERGRLVGVLTKKDAAEAWAKPDRNGLVARSLCARMPVIAYADESVRVLSDRLVSSHVGRLVIVDRADPGRITGIVSRSDILEASQRARARVLAVLAANHHGPTTTRANEALAQTDLVAHVGQLEEKPIRLPIVGR